MLLLPLLLLLLVFSSTHSILYNDTFMLRDFSRQTKRYACFNPLVWESKPNRSATAEYGIEYLFIFCCWTFVLYSPNTRATVLRLATAASLNPLLSFAMRMCLQNVCTYVNVCVCAWTTLIDYDVYNFKVSILYSFPPRSKLCIIFSFSYC